MDSLETLLTLPHPEDSALEYVVLQAADRQYWYLVDTMDEIWYYLHPPVHPDE